MYACTSVFMSFIALGVSAVVLSYSAGSAGLYVSIPYLAIALVFLSAVFVGYLTES